MESFRGTRGEKPGSVRGFQTGAAAVSLPLRSEEGGPEISLKGFFVRDPKYSVEVGADPIWQSRFSSGQSTRPMEVSFDEGGGHITPAMSQSEKKNPSVNRFFPLN